jgi:histidinol-phosphate aminotransferase
MRLGPEARLVKLLGWRGDLGYPIAQDPTYEPGGQQPMSFSRFFSRRNFLQGIGAGAAAALATPALSWPSELAGEPARNHEIGGPILLNANENPYGASERLLEAIRDAATICNRYPIRQYAPLTAHLAAMHGVSEDRVVLGVGSTEILQTSVLAFARGKKTVTGSPTYEVVGKQVQLMGAELKTVPLMADWSHDLDAMLEQTDANTGLVYICNPNNPTATITPRKQIEAFIAKMPAGTMLLIDEAYHHYVPASETNYASFIDRPVNDPRLIVARTFSKIYAMAGMRLGYAVTSPEVAARLWGHRVNSAISTITARSAITALDDTETAHHNAEINARDRADFFRQAHKRGLKPIESQANFAMFDTGRPVEEVIAFFSKNNILVGRKFPPLDTHLRVSFGTPPEMEEFWRVWDSLAATAKA